MSERLPKSTVKGTGAHLAINNVLAWEVSGDSISMKINLNTFACILKTASFAFQTPRRACARVTCAFHISLLRTLSLSFLKLNILERT